MAVPADLETSLPVFCFDMAEPMAESNGLPGVLGVLADPKEAKAPEPRPKALDAPVVGDATEPPGVLNGLALPWAEVSPPWRFEKDALREESPFAGVDRESLLEL